MPSENPVPPRWHYSGPDPQCKPFPNGENALTYPHIIPPDDDDDDDDADNGDHGDNNNSDKKKKNSAAAMARTSGTYYKIDLGSYRRNDVTNVGIDGSIGRQYFDIGLRLMLSYQHEMASRCFLACLEYLPYCVMAHAFVALCHSPNYNFKGEAYYESAHHMDEVNSHDLLCVFPSQQVADRHSKMAVSKIEYIRRLHRNQRQQQQQQKNNNKKGGGKNKNKKGGNNNNNNKNNNSSNNNKKDGDNNGPNNNNNNTEMPDIISDLETQFCTAIRILTCQPGVDPSLSVETVGRPYADAMRTVYQKYPKDPDIAYCFAESLMVLNAWQLYEYPTGKPVSPDVDETRNVLERSLKMHKNHAGLCHMYVHLSEMSSHPGKALKACAPLRDHFPHAGHLIHMPTHIDVLVGDYESCIKYNYHAILADEKIMTASPQTSGKESFYFGYIVHNYHMAVYGAILGAMEGKAMELALRLNELVNEEMFREYPDLTAYLESYSALEIHVMIRFGRWNEIINNISYPKDKNLMLFRSATICFAKSLAYAALGDLTNAQKESDRFHNLRNKEETHHRILHNNTVAALLEVDAVMLKGEICYRQKKYHDAFNLLRRAVQMQDDLNYDEPWGKMQPIRHALGGLLLEQNHLEEAIDVFEKDLIYHPNNPWAIIGLINCYKKMRIKQQQQQPKGQKEEEDKEEANGKNKSNAATDKNDGNNNKGSPEASSCCSCEEKKKKNTNNNESAPTVNGSSSDTTAALDLDKKITELTEQYEKQREAEWADFDVQVACECCQRS